MLTGLGKQEMASILDAVARHMGIKTTKITGYTSYL